MTSGNSRTSIFLSILFMVALGLIFLSMARCSVDTSIAVHAAEVHGFKDPEVIDYSLAAQWYGCSDSDSVAYKVRATNPAGERVVILVCSGWPAKGATIRVPTH